MNKKRHKNPIFVFYILVFYVFAQFTWWWYLIFDLNKSLLGSKEFSEKKLWMILGEGGVFFALLIIGVIGVKQAIKRQQKLIKKEENFLLSVSHELKTPIASVQLFLQTLQKRQSTLSDQQKNTIYDQALQEVKRLDGIVSNILFARQIDNDDTHLQKDWVQLDDFIQTKSDVFKATICQSHQLSLDLSPIKAQIDPNALNSILTNLVENAVKYSPKQSQIHIQLKEQGKHFVLSVSDQGKGISTANKSDIFKKFYREENEMTRQTKGTGLGLYIVWNLVRLHKGKIRLKDNQPTGLIFEIEIPKQ